MAYPGHRSCNSDMRAGMTDGSYKKAAPNRGGVVESTTFEIRRQMCGIWHGFNDTPMKVLPDGRTDHPPYYADVASEDGRDN